MDHAGMSHDGAAGPTRPGRVSVIDTSTLEVIATIESGAYAAGMGTATPLR
jgi:DNA-binding beta-propeller fold protein YncE